MQVKHLAVITADRAGCSCGKWERHCGGGGRTETSGQFIQRAYIEHKEHVQGYAEPSPQGARQSHMFDEQEMF